MKILDYLKNNEVILGINLIAFIIVFAFIYFVDENLGIIFIIFFIWFVPLLTYMLIDYLRYKKYFNNLKSIINNLDQKYLLPEVVKEAEFVVGAEINNILKELGRDMNEHVKYYRNIKEEYKEYIEMWVHEIKTPIASSKLLMENNITETTRIINNQMNRIENFVEQVLYYSRSDEVSNDYIIKKIVLSSIIQKVINKNATDFISKKINLKLDNIDEFIYSDEKWIEFILNQIVGNSIKYCKGKENKINIYTKKLDNSVVLIVEDNGVGIIDRDLKRVFEKGFTGENGRRFGKSTGMGLYLCKKLCSKLGILLNIQSKINKGTKVELLFPIDRNVNIINND
ncbi:sensor histidine kinase [Clostridium estertheticum]|uniref:sensor histidine kinase n=1 Tax=Clostridium estertheticum TaxID=238834 RepID=UPI001C0B0A67|nr:sensor histidine kinase [Clostridium estertheticum]MBU3216772.1 sensor histidine kinase [Clostridium estertheticum]WAG54264.1 sensor histidine kinase [Clostridium estertheticum]